MALASDPSQYVPTPTGEIAASANFYWSGTAWQCLTMPSSAAEGSPADAAWVSGSGSLVALGKAMVNSINAPLPAGTNQIGLVTAGGYTAMIQVTPTVQAAAYAVNTVLGGLITFSTAARISGGSGIIQSVAASFVSGVVPSLDVIFFNASPTGSTITDKVAVSVAPADAGKIIGFVQITSGIPLGALSYNQAGQNAMPFGAVAGTTIYAAVVTRTAITLTSTSDMILSARVLQD